MTAYQTPSQCRLGFSKWPRPCLQLKRIQKCSWTTTTSTTHALGQPTLSSSARNFCVAAPLHNCNLCPTDIFNLLRISHILKLYTRYRPEADKDVRNSDPRPTNNTRRALFSTTDADVLDEQNVCSTSLHFENSSRCLRCRLL